MSEKVGGGGFTFFVNRLDLAEMYIRKDSKAPTFVSIFYVYLDAMLVFKKLIALDLGTICRQCRIHKEKIDVGCIAQIRYPLPKEASPFEKTRTRKVAFFAMPRSFLRGSI